MRTLTWDQGREMARHQRLTHDTGVDVFFAHPHSPWERGTNENTNGLLREYFPKAVDINQSDSYVEAKMKEINLRPRKCLNWKTPYEVYHSVELHLI